MAIPRWPIWAATMDAHLAAIRKFESFDGEVPVDALTLKLVDGYRKYLFSRSDQSLGPQAFSRSTVRHGASHVNAFLSWLLKQPCYRRLPADLTDYL